MSQEDVILMDNVSNGITTNSKGNLEMVFGDFSDTEFSEIDFLASNFPKNISDNKFSDIYIF